MHVVNWRVAVWAILGFALVMTPTSIASGAAVKAAGPVKATATPKATNANNANTVPAATLTALHQAHTLLQTAIHDYDGHRGKAQAELHHAIRELTTHTHTAGAKPAAKGANGANGANNGNNGNNGTTPGETQAQSDIQLKQALQLIASVSIPNNHPKAAAHLQTALTELNVALKIK